MRQKQKHKAILKCFEQKIVLHCFQGRLLVLILRQLVITANIAVIDTKYCLHQRKENIVNCQKIQIDVCMFYFVHNLVKIEGKCL